MILFVCIYLGLSLFPTSLEGPKDKPGCLLVPILALEPSTLDQCGDQNRSAEEERERKGEDDGFFVPALISQLRPQTRPSDKTVFHWQLHLQCLRLLLTEGCAALYSSMTPILGVPGCTSWTALLCDLLALRAWYLGPLVSAQPQVGCLPDITLSWFGSEKTCGEFKLLNQF